MSRSVLKGTHGLLSSALFTFRNFWKSLTLPLLRIFVVTMDAEAEGIHPQSNPVGLTNKERRLQKKAEKKRKLDDSTISKDDSQSSLDRKHKASSSSRNVGVAQDSLYDPENNDTSDTTPTTEKDGDNEEEVEAISHKERRKRRRMEKQSKREHSEETSVDGPRLQEQEKKEQRRSQYSLWIGNLSFNTSPQRLQEWLEENSIDGISRIHMPKGARKTEYNRGFAYVDVPSVEMMEAGVALSEGHLNGRKLLIKSGTDFSGRPRIDAAAKALASGEQVKDADEDAEGSTLIGPDGKRGKTGLTKTAQKILRAQKHPAGPTLFVGNLSFNATEDGLREMIERAAQARNDTEDKGAKQKEKMAGNVSFEEGDHPSRDFAVDGERREMNNKAATRTGAGIRKVRMGEFEDSGKCKGYVTTLFNLLSETNNAHQPSL